MKCAKRSSNNNNYCDNKSIPYKMKIMCKVCSDINYYLLYSIHLFIKQACVCVYETNGQLVHGSKAKTIKHCIEKQRIDKRTHIKFMYISCLATSFSTHRKTSKKKIVSNNNDKTTEKKKNRKKVKQNGDKLPHTLRLASPMYFK